MTGYAVGVNRAPVEVVGVSRGWWESWLPRRLFTERKSLEGKSLEGAVLLEDREGSSRRDAWGGKVGEFPLPDRLKEP